MTNSVIMNSFIMEQGINLFDSCEKHFYPEYYEQFVKSEEQIVPRSNINIKIISHGGCHDTFFLETVWNERESCLGAILK